MKKQSFLNRVLDAQGADAKHEAAFRYYLQPCESGYIETTRAGDPAGNELRDVAGLLARDGFRTKEGDEYHPSYVTDLVVRAGAEKTLTLYKAEGMIKDLADEKKMRRRLMLEWREIVRRRPRFKRQCKPGCQCCICRGRQKRQDQEQ